MITSHVQSSKSSPIKGGFLNDTCQVIRFPTPSVVIDVHEADGGKSRSSSSENMLSSDPCRHMDHNRRQGLPFGVRARSLPTSAPDYHRRSQWSAGRYEERDMKPHSGTRWIKQMRCHPPDPIRDFYLAFYRDFYLAFYRD